MSERRIRRQSQPRQEGVGEDSGDRSERTPQSTARKGLRSPRRSKTPAEPANLTRRCTPVVFIDMVQTHENRLDQRPVVLQSELRVQPFSVEAVLNQETLQEMAGELLQQEEGGGEARRPGRPRRERRSRQWWKDKVNRVRDAVRSQMEAGRAGDVEVLANQAGCHTDTVRKLVRQQTLLGPLPRYDYNNQHPPEVAQRVIGLMTSDEGKYFSTSSVKQRIPQVSKKFVARTLKEQGLTYRRIRHTKPPRRFDSAEVCRVLSTALPAFNRDDESLLFLDEVIFPLNHTPTHCWRRKDQPLTGYKERTQCKTQLTCIALCSKTRVIAIQLHTEEMQAQAIIHFLTEVLQRHHTTDRVVVLLDNAKYHSANLIAQSSVGPYLLLSVPRCWELNMIEVLFSKAKEKWQRRPSVRCAEEEVSQVIRLFRECQVPVDFGGYRKQYLRNVLQILNNASLD